MNEIRLTGVSVEVELLVGPKPSRKSLLRDIDLTLSEQRICVVGANGSGKSTLLRLLNGLVEPTRGSVMVNGLDTVRDGKAVRRQVGFVFTDPLSQLVMSTPVEDIELSLRRRIRGRRERETAALELLRSRGLEALARQSIHDLSGGERQMVSLTTVLAVEPRIIVADEPTTLLDLRNRLALRAALGALEQQVIVSTHDLELAEDAERVLVVDSGRIAYDGAPAEAVSFYRELMTSRADT